MQTSHTRTFLLTWNPERRSDWPELNLESEKTRRGEIVKRRWSTGGTRNISLGDRIFLGKQGSEPKGVLASGFVSSHVFDSQHWSEPEKKTTYVQVQFDAIVTVDTLLPRTELILDDILREVRWSTQRGGIEIRKEAAVLLEDKWQTWLEGSKFLSGINGLIHSETSVQEGAVRIETHKRRERVSTLVRAKKQQALLLKGRLECEVCSMTFYERYGEHGADFIEAHHRDSLSKADSRAGTVTSLDDLALVCANCHRMLHWKDWPSIQVLKARMKSTVLVPVTE